MNEPKFTSAPWEYVRVKPDIDTFAIRTKDGDTLAVVGVSPCGWKPGKDIANAALMTASPLLYTALEKCLAYIAGSPMLRNAELENEITAALTEARNEKVKGEEECQEKSQSN